MKVLLDHCVDRHLARALAGHEVRTAGQMGWQKPRNGILLASAAGHFDVMITVDRNIRHQQNLGVLPIAAVVMAAPTIKLTDLLLLVPAVEEALSDLKPCTLVEVASSPR